MYFFINKANEFTQFDATRMGRTMKPFILPAKAREYVFPALVCVSVCL